MDFECSKSCPSPNSEYVWMKMSGVFKWLIVVESQQFFRDPTLRPSATPQGPSDAARLATGASSGGRGLQGATTADELPGLKQRSGQR